MASKKPTTQAYFLIDAEDYKTFQELKTKNQELEKQLTEALKYKQLQVHAEHAHLKAKVSDLENKLNQGQPSAPSDHLTSTESLEAKTEQTGLGGNESSVLTVTSKPADPKCDPDSSNSLRQQLFSAFEEFIKSHKLQQEQSGTGSGDVGNDLTPSLPIPVSSLSESAEPSSGHVTNSDASSPRASIDKTVSQLDNKKLLDSVPSSQKVKAQDLLCQLPNYSDELRVDLSGNIHIHGHTLPNANFYELFPLLYKPIKNYESNEGLSTLVDELASLGLAHLILRHYSVGLLPKGKNYLKNREDLKKAMPKSDPWYFLEHNE
jgi:hypothetical protein